MLFAFNDLGGVLPCDNDEHLSKPYMDAQDALSVWSTCLPPTVVVCAVHVASPEVPISEEDDRMMRWVSGSIHFGASETVRSVPTYLPYLTSRLPF